MLEMRISAPGLSSTRTETVWITRAPRRLRLPPGRAGLRRRLPPLAAPGSPGLYCSYYPLRPGTASDGRGTRGRSRLTERSRDRHRLVLAVLDEVERSRPRRDHREAVLSRVDAAVDHRRAPARERLRERRAELVLGVDAQADGAVGLRELHAVGRVLREAHLREALLEEHVLPLPDH